LTIWRATQGTCRWLLEQNEVDLSGDCIELGCGLGANSILLSWIKTVRGTGGSVTATDGDSETLKWLEKNIEANEESLGGRKADTRQLRWGVDSMGKIYDLVFASDVIYTNQIVPILVKQVAALLKSTGVWALGYAKRNVKVEDVIEEARRWGMECERPEVEGDGDGEGVFLFRYKRRERQHFDDVENFEALSEPQVSERFDEERNEELRREPDGKNADGP